MVPKTGVQCIARIGGGVWLSAAALSAAMAQAPADPPFGDTVGTVFDILRAEDPSTFQCLEAKGQAPRQIWDKRVEGEPVIAAHIFEARFSDGTRIEMAINPEFGRAEAARTEALRYAPALGQLPTSLRRGLHRFSVHDGRKAPHAGDGQVIFYAKTADQRLGYQHLEESLFHESVHASWDAQWRLSPQWLAAAAADGGFLTRYGAEHPDREDLAETALFAFAILHHPDRLPPADTADTLAAVPHRIAFIETLLPKGQPLTQTVGPFAACSGR